MLTRLAAEPPFRLLTKAVLARLPCALATRVRWELSPRPVYLLGLYTAALKARDQGLPRFCAIEFGVAAGAGLRTLQAEAFAVEAALHVGIQVIGFDAGSGLPPIARDYRDHPDYWQAGDFPMDETALRRGLPPQTELIIGPIADTLPRWIQSHQAAPVGFVSFDLDLWSSTRDALQVFAHPQARMLRQVPCYFDDIETFIAHRRAGELLAIAEFNDTYPHLVIDRWHGANREHPFPERLYWQHLYVAHDLRAISATSTARPPQLHAVPV